MTVIALLGAECTGKSALAQALSERLQIDVGLSTVWVPEVLRHWCTEHGRTPRREEQRAIAALQSQAIEEAAAHHAIVVADTTAWMISIYSELYFDDASLVSEAVAWHHEHVECTLVTATDMPWQAEGFMRDSPVMRDRVHERLRTHLIERGTAWSAVSGLGQARLESALDAVAPSLRKLSSPRAGLFTRLQARNADPTASSWRCEHCDDPDCEHALRSLAPRGAPTRLNP